MKQFDLETYNRMIAEGKTPKIVTRDGCDARILCTDKKGDYPVVAVILDSENVENVKTHMDDGKYLEGCKGPSDLFFADIEPTYRPYKDAEECFRDVIKHGGWVKDKYAIRPVSQITFKEPQGIMHDLVRIRGCNGRTYEEFLEDFVWADTGEACGVKEE